MTLDIVAYPEPALKKVASEVGEVNEQIKTLAANMIETMYAARGVGLAAPQVGESIRMIVVDPHYVDAPPNPRVLINPEIYFLGEEIVSEQEGCLSVPLGFRADVKRNNKIKVKYTDLYGNKKEEIFEEFPAIVIQHEVDHLNGILFIDKISRLKRSLYDAKIKKWLKRKN